jgi:hypothetical protein
MNIAYLALGIVLIIFGSVFVVSVATIKDTSGEDITWFIVMLYVVGVAIIVAGIAFVYGCALEE